MTIWHKRKIKIPFYWLFLVSALWVGMWLIDMRFAAQDMARVECMR